MTRESASEKIGVLMSGGLDSAVLLARTADQAGRVYPIYVRTGLFWEVAEIEHVRLFLMTLGRDNLEPLALLDLPVADLYGSHWSISGQGIPNLHSSDEAVYLPGRNLLLLSKAFVFCALKGISVLTLGLLKGNPFPDSTPGFFAAFQTAAAAALGCTVEVRTPFLEMSKAQVIQAGRDLPLELTFSCMNPVNGRHCGSCNKCAERRKAFAGSGLCDKTAYCALPPL
jgi:7-cyano-7-deazaguanine synthase